MPVYIRATKLVETGAEIKTVFTLDTPLHLVQLGIKVAIFHLVPFVFTQCNLFTPSTVVALHQEPLKEKDMKISEELSATSYFMKCKQWRFLRF